MPASCMVGSLKPFNTTQVFTYNAQDWGEEGNSTQGGYSDHYVIDNQCVLFSPRRKWRGSCDSSGVKSCGGRQSVGAACRGCQ